MIRVLEIVGLMDRGGIETMLMNIFRTIDRSKVILDFLLATDKECDYNEEIRKLGGKIYSVPSPHKGIIKNKLALENFFTKHKEYTIVHLHRGNLFWIETLMAAKRVGIPVRIIHGHSTKHNEGRLFSYLHIFHQLFVKNYATHYFACSSLAAKWMYGNKVSHDECQIINNGIICDKFIFDREKRKIVREEFGLEDDEMAIVNVARLEQPKNHDFILNIFFELHKMYPKTKLFLVGDGKRKTEIEERIHALNLKESVILTGLRRDVDFLLQGMDFFLMPSHYEGLPGAAIEAQGSGLPCLLSDTITKETAITNLVEYMSLDDTVSKWASKIFDMSKDFQRRDMQEEIKMSGFDMSKIALDLQEFYLSEYLKWKK